MIEAVEVTKEFLGFQPGDQLFLNELEGKYELVTVEEVEGEGVIGEVHDEMSLSTNVVEDNLGEYFEEISRDEQPDVDEPTQIYIEEDGRQESTSDAQGEALEAPVTEG